MATIPTDVIHTCILPRLPVKTLTRFKSVSKTWQTIISSSKFTYLQHNHARSSDTNRLIVFKKGLIFHTHELDSHLTRSLLCHLPQHKPNIYVVHILASSEFLLLINSNYYRGLILLNPSTGRYYEIPYPHNEGYNKCYGMYLDEANREYKVVKIHQTYQNFNNNRETSIEVMVYSVRDNMWRLIEPSFDKCYRIWPYGSSTVIHNFLHIFVVVPSSQEHNSNTNAIKSISCFDILAEKWTNDVPLPHFNDLKSIKLSVLDGLLCVTVTDREETGSRNWGVWVMKEYGDKDSWFKLMSIADNTWYYLDCYPIAYRTGSQHEVLCRKISNNEYIWYNVREKKAIRTTIDRVIPKATKGIIGYICKGSLVDFPGGRNMELHEPK